MRAIRRFTINPALPEQLAPLRGLMLNLRWSWHTETSEVFAAIDPAAWDRAGGDPVTLLAQVPQERLARLAGDRKFLRRLSDAADDLRDYLTSPRWYQGADASLPDAPAAVAYFSPEFGVTAALPQYSGGLGILAGDHLKAASDLGVPLIGVGLLYRHGYFTQSLSAEGWQVERYPASDPNGLPLTLLRDAGGSPARIWVALADGAALAAQIWIAQVGRVPLLLLDSYVEENEPAMREITDRLYGGGTEHRLSQELLLGIGGVRAVRAYCAATGHPEPDVFHTNEGHAGFQGVERIREYLEQGLGFDEALELCRAGTVFTTHTPVPAGIDRFPVDLVGRQFSGQAAEGALSADRVLALGAENYPGGDPAVFNMAVMGMRLAQRVNGVSKLHGQVSREMFAGLWPGFDTAEVPIGSVTNGVHGPTWVAPEIMSLAHGSQPGSGDLGDDAEAWDRVAADSGQVWELRRLLRARLIAQARQRLRASWRQRGASDAELIWIDGVLDEDVLTIGFARRVPSYKRLTLMLHDQERLMELLLDPDRPVQIVIAGKAHPADEGGKLLIQQMVKFADDPRVRHRIVFLPDYDMALARSLVQGCDIWLNNPLRPLEACGTSGMKAALNGGLNLSVLDGWWDEWFDGADGWAIPSADGVTDPARRDELEAAALYDLLGQSVAPLFYDRGPDGQPRRWLEMVAHTLRTLGPLAQATRMVREYVTELYVPAARSSAALARGKAADGGEAEAFGGASELAAWKQRVRAAWPGVRVEHVEADDGDLTPGGRLTIRASIALGDLTPDDVSVEVVFGRAGDADEIINPECRPLALDSGPADGVSRYVGHAELGEPGPFGYTVRVLPSNPLLPNPAELGLIAVPAGASGMVNGDLR
ncbi:MAG TPA: alpha-glucan family phosphorylase [Streptosporangiaceae bacterium]|nr:alpha-glucan family phosphorylase [Streptosporangiaceae bacterium]